MAAVRVIRFLRRLLDVDDTNRAAGKMLQVDVDGETHIYVDPPAGGGGGGAPTGADYLVGTSDLTLTNEIVVGATPGGELGGTWASPTVDTIHSGSSHAATQAAAEATAAAALAAHIAADVVDGDTAGGVLSGTYPNPGFASDMATQAELDAHINDTTDAHDASAISNVAAGGIVSTDVQAAINELDTEKVSTTTFNDHSARHENGGADEISIAGLDGTSTELANHLADATDAHDASAVSVDSTNLSGTAITVQGSLEELDNLLDDHSSRHENGGADEISIAGLDGTPTALQTHLDDASDAHDASAISVLDAAGDYTATDVEGVLAEIAPQLGGGSFAYATYTPSLTASVSNPTLGSGSSQAGLWGQIGDLGVVHFRIDFGSSGTAAGSGDYRVSLPFTIGASMPGSSGGTGICYDSSANDTFPFMVIASAGNAFVSFFLSSSTNAGSVTHNVPLPWGASDFISGLIVCRVA